MRIIECAEGYYEAQDVEFGRVYRWCPETVVVECDCGERLSLTGSVTACECGADHTTAVRERLSVLRQLEDETAHPWRYARDREGIGIPC